MVVHFGEICLLSALSSPWELLSLQHSIHPLSGWSRSRDTGTQMAADPFPKLCSAAVAVN